MLGSSPLKFNEFNIVHSSRKNSRQKYLLSITGMGKNVLIINDQILGMFAGDSCKLLQSPADHLSVHVLIVGEVQDCDATLTF